jgi:uncharacterized protein (UPF0264 family)
MSMQSVRRNKPGLLVSVRSAAEAVTALAGGADVIDVKEPNRGSLGAVDGETLSAVIDAVDGRAIVTAAMGELVELMDGENTHGSVHIPPGVSLFKLGLAQCALRRDWQTHLHRVIARLAAPSGNAKPVAVAYADWRTAQSPQPRDVLRAAIEFGCPALLIDTQNKSTGSLFDHWPIDDLQLFLREVHSQKLAVVLAGSLVEDAIVHAARLMPDLVAVRTAACDAGRGGTVTLERVRGVKQAINAATRHEAAV